MFTREDGLEVYEPSECFFGLYQRDDSVEIAIVSKDQWETNQCLDDQMQDDALTVEIPFPMSMESIWVTERPMETVASIMTKLGFERSQELDDQMEVWG